MLLTQGEVMGQGARNKETRQTQLRADEIAVGCSEDFPWCPPFVPPGSCVGVQEHAAWFLCKRTLKRGTRWENNHCLPTRGTTAFIPQL